jgi:hypothetical protein
MSNNKCQSSLSKIEYSTKKSRVQLDPVKGNPKNKYVDLKGLKLVPTLYFKNVGVESIKYIERRHLFKKYVYFGWWAFSLMFFCNF